MVSPQKAVQSATEGGELGSSVSEFRTDERRQDEPRLHRVVLDDLRRSGLRGTLARDVQDLYDFYLDEPRRARLESMGRVRRFFVVGFWLFRGLLLKLHPTRRLMLLAAILLGLFGEVSFNLGGDVRVGVDPRFWGILLLLVVLMLELKDKLLARDEIEVAREVQLALLPKRAPNCEGFALWSVTLPANDVGGDLIDYLPLDGRRLGAALGDVAGKGLGAALLMAKLQATLRALAPSCPRLADLGSQINGILHRDGLENRYATLFYLELTPGVGSVRYLNAGHNPPYVIRGATLQTVPSSSLPLGMLPGTTFVEGRVEMNPGDLLVVYSDGLTEARNASGDEFGTERLEALLRQLGVDSPERSGERILAEFRRFVGNERTHDDLSLLLVRREA